MSLDNFWEMNWLYSGAIVLKRGDTLVPHRAVLSASEGLENIVVRFGVDIGNPNETKSTSFEIWKSEYMERIREEKRNDPKTFIGWALKGFK